MIDVEEKFLVQLLNWLVALKICVHHQFDMFI